MFLVLCHIIQTDPDNPRIRNGASPGEQQIPEDSAGESKTINPPIRKKNPSIVGRFSDDIERKRKESTRKLPRTEICSRRRPRIFKIRTKRLRMHLSFNNRRSHTWNPTCGTPTGKCQHSVQG
jgi:hypothetical protein